jgi:hypothetical protein
LIFPEGNFAYHAEADIFAMAAEVSIESLVEYRWAADENLADFVGVAFAQLALDEGVVPSCWIDLFLREPFVQLEVVASVALAKGCKRGDQLHANAFSLGLKRDVESEFESIELDAVR